MFVLVISPSTEMAQDYIAKPTPLHVKMHRCTCFMYNRCNGVNGANGTDGTVTRAYTQRLPNGTVVCTLHVTAHTIHFITIATFATFPTEENYIHIWQLSIAITNQTFMTNWYNDEIQRGMLLTMSIDQSRKLFEFKYLYRMSQRFDDFVNFECSTDIFCLTSYTCPFFSFSTFAHVIL